MTATRRGALRGALLLLLAAAATRLPGAAATLPRCTLSQADASKTNFRFEFASSKSWESVSKNGKVRTPYNQYCFKISTQAKYPNPNATAGAPQACKEAGFGPEHCCADVGALVINLPVDPACAADKATLAQLPKAWFTLDPTATAKSTRGITAAFRRASRAGGAVDRFEIVVKASTAIGAGRDLCVNVPAANSNKCKTLLELCAGGLCTANITTGRFKVGKKLQTCCVAARAQVGGACTPSCKNGGNCTAANTCDCAGTGFTGPTCSDPVNGVVVSIKLTGIQYDPSMDAAIISAAVGALGLPDYNASNVQVVVRSTGARRRALLANRGILLDLVFAATSAHDRAALEQATSSSGTFLSLFRNLVSEMLPFIQDGLVCLSDGASGCKGQEYVVIKPITACQVDVCFLIDGSGSILSPHWQVEASVVDSLVRSIGDNTSRIAIVEFSSATYVHVPLKPRAEVDALFLRTARKTGSGGTNMAAGISVCLAQLDYKSASAARANAPVVVLLTDGKPDSKPAPRGAAEEARDTGVTFVTIGVGEADLDFLADVASGPSYVFSSAAFNNDATNLGTKVAPALCGAAAAGPAPQCQLRTVNNPEVGMYVKPHPCYAAKPSAESLQNGVTACTTFQWTGRKSRGDCSQYPGEQPDLTQCWMEVVFTPPGSSKRIEGWVQSAKTTATGPLTADEVCGPPVNVYVAPCTNTECTYDAIVYGAGTAGVAATLNLHKTLAALRPDPPRRPRIMLIATGSKVGGLAVTGAQNFYDITGAKEENPAKPNEWTQPVEGWHKAFYTAAGVIANGHAYGLNKLEGVLRAELDNLSPAVNLRLDYDLTRVRAGQDKSLASVSVKKMLPWQAADPKHREFDPMRVEEVYTARTFVDASETGRMTYMAAQASNGAIQFTWGRENRWSTNTAQGGIRPLTPTHDPAQDKAQMSATLLFQVTNLTYPDRFLNFPRGAVYRSMDKCLPYDYDFQANPSVSCAAVEPPSPDPKARFYMKGPNAAVDMDHLPTDGRGAVWWFNTAVTYHVDGLCEPAKYGRPCTFATDLSDHGKGPAGMSLDEGYDATVKWINTAGREGMMEKLRQRFPGAALRCVRKDDGKEVDGDGPTGLCGAGTVPVVAEQMYVRETIHAYDRDYGSGKYSVSAMDALWGNNDDGLTTILQSAYRQDSNGYTADQQGDTSNPWLWKDQNNCKLKDANRPIVSVPLKTILTAVPNLISCGYAASIHPWAWAELRPLPTLTGLGDAGGVAAAFAAAGKDVRAHTADIVKILKGASDALARLDHPALIVNGTFNLQRPCAPAAPVKDASGKDDCSKQPAHYFCKPGWDCNAATGSCKGPTKSGLECIWDNDCVAPAATCDLVSNWSDNPLASKPYQCKI